MRRLVYALAAFVAAAAPARGEGWGQYATWQVRRTVTIPAGDAKTAKLPDMDCVFVSFPTAEFLQPDGGDLRVEVGGKPAPFKVVNIAFGGVVSLVAGIAAPSDTVHVYYGNPAAKALASDWEPRRGLWLETRHVRGEPPKSLDAARAAWAKGTRLGAAPVSQIFHGFNLFGPSDDYMSLYKGWLALDKETTATFAITADDVGYLLVDGNLAAAKPQPGPMPGDRHIASEPLTLKQGLHSLTFIHAEGTGPQAAGVAWWMQGMSRGKQYLHFQLIPPQAFAPLRYGKLTDYEVRGQAIGADFSAVNDGDVVLDDGKMLVRFVFKDQSRPANRALQCQPHWDFGDGTSSDARDPTHIYLRPGDYAVTLTLKSQNATYQVRQKVRAGPGYTRAAAAQWDHLDNYAPILAEYQFEKMATADLLVAAQAAGEVEPEDSALIVAACRVLVQRGKELDDEAFVRHSLLLGRHVRDLKLKDEEKAEPKAVEQHRRERAEEALAVFAAAEKRTGDLAAKARLANEQGDIYYYYLNDLEKAEKEYTKTLTTYSKAADAQVRLAQIRIGDVYRTKGDPPAALAAYQKAAEMPIHNRTEGVEAARRGSFPRTVEDYTARKLYKEAHQALDEWDWEFPTDKLAGYSSLLRARLAAAEGNKKEAVKQAEELVRGNKESEYADDLLLFLTNFYFGDGVLDKALDAVNRLLTGYPASDLQSEARLKRATIYMQQGKPDEAAKEALDLATTNPDGEHAPKALLLAAKAQVAAKKKDEAIKTLERLAQKHPTAAETTESLKLLKELRPK
ncbi:MAG: tetratricopeptide repeat protein [Planctomycetes bacterium]|nr:tetratricopeptide repeat protein [Planctomycetota bacterium]